MSGNGIAWCVSPDGSPGLSWNPVVGCSPVSAGCQSCWAAAMASRGLCAAHRGLAVRGHWIPGAGPRFLPETLAIPLRRRKPTGYAVCLMGDLFHDGVTDGQIAAVFGVMAAAQQHRFYVLAKRAARMEQWFGDESRPKQVSTFSGIALAGRLQEYFKEERTAPIAGWPGYYITSRGRVLSEWSKSGQRITVAHEIKPMPSEPGHCRAMLYRDGSTERHLVHRLVLEHFDRLAVDGEQGRHIDGDPGNNALWNLRWGSQTDNRRDSNEHGTGRRYQKLTPEQVAEIRSRASAGESAASLGRGFAVSDTQVRNIIHARQWAAESALSWPLRNVFLGVSVENQATADERIPHLLRCPAAVRWVSAEPLLGPISLVGTGILACGDAGWVVVGGESGPRARPCDLGWIRSIRDQCRAAGVPVFVKQLGRHPVADGREQPVMFADRDRKDPRSHPADLQIHEFPEVTP